MKRRKRRRYKPRSTPTTDPPRLPLRRYEFASLRAKRSRKKAASLGRPLFVCSIRFAASIRSDFAIVEQQHICAAGREFWHVGPRCLAFGAAEAGLNGCKVVKMQGGDEMEAGRPRGRPYRALADFIFSQAGYFLCNGNMRFKIIFVESSCILWGLVHHHDVRHCVSPYCKNSYALASNPPLCLS